MAAVAPASARDVPPRTKKGFSPRTVQASRNALARLLGAAKRDGLVSQVATTGASQVRRMLADGDGPISKALEPDRVRRLVGAAAGTQWEPLLATLALLGLRRGEALAISWNDIDLDAAVVTIRRSLSRVQLAGRTTLVLTPTKTRSSRRPLRMPPILVLLLRAWRAEQARLRLRAGERWTAQWAREAPVFTTPLGTPVDPGAARVRAGRARLRSRDPWGCYRLTTSGR